MPIHLRGKKCALAGAFLRWMLFNALLAFASFLYFGSVFRIVPKTVRSLLFDWSDPMYTGIWPVFTGPEMMIEGILFDYVLAYRGWSNKLEDVVLVSVLVLVLSALRLGVVFAWGVARLRRGKHAPYAETLWLIVICACVSAWQSEKLNVYEFTIPFYVLLALLAITGVVAFVIQRLRPPAWKWKTPE